MECLCVYYLLCIFGMYMRCIYFIWILFRNLNICSYTDILRFVCGTNIANCFITFQLGFLIARTPVVYVIEVLFVFKTGAWSSTQTKDSDAATKPFI